MNFSFFFLENILIKKEKFPIVLVPKNILRYTARSWAYPRLRKLYSSAPRLRLGFDSYSFLSLGKAYFLAQQRNILFLDNYTAETIREMDSNKLFKQFWNSAQSGDGTIVRNIIFITTLEYRTHPTPFPDFWKNSPLKRFIKDKKSGLARA